MPAGETVRFTAPSAVSGEAVPVSLTKTEMSALRPTSSGAGVTERSTLSGT